MSTNHGAATGAGAGAGPSSATAARTVAAVCIVVPFVAILWLPSFDKSSPKLFGFPFFYWYQLLWVLITAVLMVVAHLALGRDRAAKRTASAELEVSPNEEEGDSE